MGVAELAIGVGGLLVAFLAYLVGRRSLRPSRRQLQVLIDEPISMIPPNHAGTPLLEVRTGGLVLSDPCLTTIYVKVAGTHDISSDMFEGGRGVSFAVPVGTVLLESTPDNVHVSLQGTELLLGPSLLKVGVEVRLSLLTEGEPDLALPNVPVANVQCVNQMEANHRRVQMARSAFSVGLPVTFVALVVGLCGDWLDRRYDAVPDRALSAFEWNAWNTVAVVAILLALTLSLITAAVSSKTSWKPRK